MKNIAVFSFFILMSISGLLCNAQTVKEETKGVNSVKVEAYYFHLAARCVTCKAVEAEAKKSLETLYSGNVSFQAINLEDAANKAIIEKLQISGQTLLIVKGGTKINLTNEGFLYARSNPEKFKSIIKEKVDRLIKL
jgi:hypothetical protein